MTRLDPRLRELAILRIAVLNRAGYEWQAHEPIARQCGIPEATVAAVRHGPEHPDLGPAERTVLAYTDAMTREVTVDREVYSAVERLLPAGGRPPAPANLAFARSQRARGPGEAAGRQGGRRTRGGRMRRRRAHQHVPSQARPGVRPDRRGRGQRGRRPAGARVLVCRGMHRPERTRHRAGDLPVGIGVRRTRVPRLARAAGPRHCFAVRGRQAALRALPGSGQRIEPVAGKWVCRFSMTWLHRPVTWVYHTIIGS